MEKNSATTNMEFQTNQYEARIQWLSDEVMRLVKLLAEEKQVNMNLCAIIAKLEEKHGK